MGHELRKPIRRNGNTLEMPIVTMEHPRTKRKGVVFGIIHFWDREYYKKTHCRVLDLEQSGYLILYEMVGKITRAQYSRLSKEEKKIYRGLVGSHHVMKKVAEIIGISLQREELPIGKNWVNTDIRLAELVKRIASKNAGVPEKPNMEGDIPKKIKPFIQWFLSKLIVNIGLITSLTKKDRNEVIVSGEIVERRDAIAIKGIARFPEQNIATIWGASHLPGIVKGLTEQHGHVILKVEWVPAYTRTYFLKDAVRDTWDSK